MSMLSDSERPRQRTVFLGHSCKDSHDQNGLENQDHQQPAALHLDLLLVCNSKTLPFFPKPSTLECFVLLVAK
jgi:hypothetical protein